MVCNMSFLSADDVFVLLIAALHQNAKKSSFRQALTVAESRLRSGKIRRGALLPPSESAFMHLFNSGQDDALITLCGFDHESFAMLLNLFEPYFDQYTPHMLNKDSSSSAGYFKRVKKGKSGKRQGRPRIFTAVMVLGLVLAWTRTRGSYKVLQIIFGFTSTPLSLWLRFGRRVLVQVLQKHPLARVEMPNEEQLQDFTEAISGKYPSLSNVWGAMDGLKLLLEVAGDNNTQNNFYNGWTHDHYVSNLFLFSPDGKIRKMFLNAPGCWHDSTLGNASGMYPALEEIFNAHGGRVVADSAFSKMRWKAILKSHKSILDRAGNVRQRASVFRAATSVRQLSEWGMRGLQGSFPRLKDRLQYEERGERKIILLLVALLYNFRASTVGQNQIQSTFMPHLKQDVNNYIFGAI